MNSDFKTKFNNMAAQQTGTDFFNPITHSHDESFSYEIQIQKEYLQRLKVQRQKIEGLYSKYDVLLTEMKKKDSVIKEKQDKMRTMDGKIKDLELNCQQLSMVHEQGREIVNQNMELKHRILYLESENAEMVEQMKLRDSLVSDQKNELDSVNDQLQEKIRSLANKLFACQQQLKNNLQTERQRMQALKAQHLAEVSAMSGENNALKNKIMKLEETVHILRLDGQFLSQKMSDQEENYSVYLKDLEAKIEKSQKEKKLQLQALKNTIEEKSLEISTLQSRISAMKSQLQIREIETSETKKLFKQQKKLFDDDIFQLKQQMNNEKLYFREQLMYCQNHIEKLEKKLNESLKREKDLGDRIKRHEVNEVAKRNLRQIQRQQLEKINKILSYQ